MKKLKIIILISFLFLITGCNYLELSNMGIVSLMSIKYDDNKYTITIELRENIKEDEEASTIHTATDTSIEKALEQISMSVDRTLYFIDLNVLLLDENTINQKLTSIIDYLTRDVTFGTNFNILVDNNQEETIKLLNKKKKIAGEYIKNIFDNKKNNIINYKFYSFLKIYLSEFQDVVLPFGSIDNNEYFINEAVIFKEKKIVSHLPFKLLQTYNLLMNAKADYYYQINLNNNKVVYRLSNHKTKINYNNNTINLTVNTNGAFIEIENIDLNKQNINKLMTKINNKINNDIQEIIAITKTYDCDILNIKKIIYNTKRKKISSVKNIEYTTHLNTNLDREGLLFDSLGDIYEQR